MRALVFEARWPALALSGAASRLSQTGALRVAPPARLRELDDPVPPGPGWLGVEPVLAGICGSDVHQLCLDADPDNALSAIIRFPHVPGHEAVVRGPGEQLFALDPWLSCETRAADPCAACEAGHPPLCEHAVEGEGMHLGNTPALPGAFSTRMLAHRSQLHPLPDGLDPRAAVLMDPLAVAIHAVERAGLEGGDEPVVVLGAGTIGLCVAAVLRRLHPDRRLLVTAAWPHLKAEVQALGGKPVGLSAGDLVAAVAEAAGVEPLRPWRGGPWLPRGAGAVIDTIGSSDTLASALRVVSPRRRVVIVGVGRGRATDQTLAYFKEVETVGSNGYGRGAPGRALQMLAAGDLPWERWLTHSFPLERWRDGFLAARRPGRSGAIKVVIEP